MQYEKTLTSTLKIRFHDCDPFNHLNNSRYIDYIISERSEQLLDNYDLDIYRLAREKGIGWATFQTQISYLTPAVVGEEVTIQTRLLVYSEKSLLLEGLMWSKDGTVLKAVMWTKLAHFDIITQKSLSHAPDLLRFFEQIVNPLPEKVLFETRVKNLNIKQ